MSDDVDDPQIDYTLSGPRRTQKSPRGGPERTAAHGTPSRWRTGCRCDECRTAHLQDQRNLLARRATQYWAEHGPTLCGLLAGGTRYRHALDAVGTTAQAVTAQRRRDPDFAARLDAALMAGRETWIIHGSHAGWKAGCRCPECAATRRAYP